MTKYIEIHALQSVPPANINRDDSGSPKTAVIGGTQRIRVSSQAWKRAMRDEFTKQGVATGVRTKRLAAAVADHITAISSDIDHENATRFADVVLGESGFTVFDPKKYEHRAVAIAFVTDGQLASLARFAVDNEAAVNRIAEMNDAIAMAKPADAKRITAEKTAALAEMKLTPAVKAALNGSASLDLALFGRMFASNNGLNVDAAAQVQHAFSVHAAEIEYDFFTAVDELDPSSGSAMLGTSEFASATFYRQTVLNLDALKKMVGSDYVDGAATYIRSFIESMPTGKQNSTSPRTLPVAVIITVRDGAPRNYVDAFTNAVEADERGIVENAANRLAETAKEFDFAYGTRSSTSFIVRVGQETAALDQLGERTSLDDAISGVTALLTSGS